MLFALGALALVLCFGLIFNADGAFFRGYIHTATLGQLSGYLIMACGMTIVILSGGIDLSAGSIVAISGVLASHLYKDLQWPAAAAMGAGLLSGVACGATSGIAVAYFRLQPFVATLAMMAFARGVAKWTTEGKKVVLMDMPASWDWLDRNIPIAGGFQLPTVVLPAIACVGMVLVLLRRTPLGLDIYAIGDNEQAARYAGVAVRRIKLLTYCISGLAAAMAGIAFSIREHQGNPDGGMGYELTAIAMVVVGGTSLSGGRGGAALTLLGALVIGYLKTILDMNGFDPDKQLMITGAILALAALAQGLRRR